MTTPASSCILRATLVSSDRSKELLAYEIARDVLDILKNPDHHAIVDELASSDLAAELEKKGATPANLVSGKAGKRLRAW
jgi:hypothetical protein